MVRRPSEVVVAAIWARRLYRPALVTVAGEPVEVLYPGEARGAEGGPDFRAARLRIGNLLWVGDVEVDVEPQGWYQHRHHEKADYERVIAQVVWQASATSEIRDRQGRTVPVIPLSVCVEEGLRARLIQGNRPFPCAALAREAPAPLWEALYEAEGEARMRSRHGHYRTLDDLYQAFWEALLYALGLPTLGEAFRQIARAVPLSFLLRYQSEALSLEALLLGIAGLLEGLSPGKHPYEGEILERWAYLRVKHQLAPLSLRWPRYRPPASPAIRLSIAAQLIACYPDTGSLIGHPPENLPLPSPYWQRHWAWQKPLPHLLKNPSTLLLQNLRLNALYPFAIYYYRHAGQLERALDYVERLRAMPPESNRITRLYAGWAYPARSAWQSQGQIQLWRERCSRQACLSCPVGQYLRRHA